ncbi:MAG TPA: hypothetical protein PK360_00085 [bacterium]|nr:hypothetical protein [bacterium]
MKTQSCIGEAMNNMKPISRKEAIRISREIMDIAERERLAVAEMAAWEDRKIEKINHRWKQMVAVIFVLNLVVLSMAVSGWMARHFVTLW